MDITLHLMSVDEKALLIRMMELYNYEFSAFSNDDINEYGSMDMITLMIIGMRKEDFLI